MGGEDEEASGAEEGTEASGGTLPLTPDQQQASGDTPTQTTEPGGGRAGLAAWWEGARTQVKVAIIGGAFALLVAVVEGFFGLGGKIVEAASSKDAPTSASSNGPTTSTPTSTPSVSPIEPTSTTAVTTSPSANVIAPSEPSDTRLPPLAIREDDETTSPANDPPANAPALPTTEPSPSQILLPESDMAVLGSYSSVEVRDVPPAISILGQAEKGITAVYVLVGPRPDGDRQFWSAVAEVNPNGSWQLVVSTPPAVPPNYQVKAYFLPGALQGAPPVVGADPMVPAMSSPALVLACAEQLGPKCLPQLGPPAVYSGSR